MYKNKKILVIGSGAILIGQACEFDYSGVQACKTFKNENMKVILLNNNPATVMTDDIYNDRTYFKPINLFNLKKIIKKEKPEYIYSSVGGQTSINLLLDLYKNKKYIKKVKLLGINFKAIKNSESRKKFKNIMKKNNLPIAYSKIARNIKESLKIRKKIIKKTKNKNISIRPSYTLGGLGGGISNNLNNFINICKKGILLSKNKEIIIEESLYGFKEIELEILIDKDNNFINVCSIENFDPVGIHTGDSICFSPIQTLTNKEYQRIRLISKKTIKKLGIKCGGANIQFALNSYLNRIIIIEVNPRMSRSSALASKATGYPIAEISTKLSLKYNLNNINNKIIKKITSFFEPSIDYIVTKSPLFCVEKFGYYKILINNQMKSVGESMSIGENFEDSIQKSLNNNINGFLNETFEKKNLYKKIFFPNNERIDNIYEFIKFGKSIKLINYLSKIDCFFLNKIKNIIVLENKIKKKKIIKKNFFIILKKKGISDKKISILSNNKLKNIINYRIKNKIFPCYKRVDNCSREFDTFINYYYSSYSNFCEYNDKKKKKVIILGSGPNNIGQGIEFDYCCVHASFYLKSKNYISVILNNNPETVSTDHDISNFLFFLSPNFENLFNLFKKINPFGVLIQFCGQLSNSILNYIKKYKIKILGTSIKNIKKTENRKKFKKEINKINLLQPKSFMLKKEEDFKKKKFDFPNLLRPSFVLGGKDMKVINNKYDLINYYNLYIKNKKINFPILVDEYLKCCLEIDVDGISNGKNSYIFPVIEHVEKVGIHSGDSTSFIPTFLKKNVIKKIKKISKKISLKFNLIGSFNIQFALDKRKRKIYIIELNPRASRTIPFLIKSIKTNIIKKSMDCIFFNKINIKKKKIYMYFMKEPVFSFLKFKNSDVILGPEMKSTGEIISIGKNIYYTYYNSQISVGLKNFKYINLLVNDKKILKLSKKTNKIIYKKKIKIKNNSILIITSKFNKYKIERLKLKDIGVPIYTTSESAILLLKSLKYV
ncbi:carbamoyl-phosphate synthase large subunit [Candidatus Vidania fulgoroideorum]